MPLSGGLEHFNALLKNIAKKPKNDADWIKLALTAPRSASGENYRGKGLRKMKESLADFPNSTLSVYSKKGECLVSHDGEISSKLHGRPLGGTLITWEIYASKN